MNYLQQIFASTYHQTDWFVSFKQAVKGLTHEQATQKIHKDSQSIFEIVAHLVYWNERYLKKMKGEEQESPMQTDNEKTFTGSQFSNWHELLAKAELVFGGWTTHLKTLSDQDAEHFTAITNTALHNAYHIGQIVTIRKVQGSWDPRLGVK